MSKKNALALFYNLLKRAVKKQLFACMHDIQHPWPFGEIQVTLFKKLHLGPAGGRNLCSMLHLVLELG